MLFVDSNVPMYLVGDHHRNRDLLEAFVRAHPDEEYVTSAEVYQEIVHRYVAIDRRQAIGDCFRLLDSLVRHVHPITRQDVDRAAAICSLQRRLSSRDGLHVAIMERFGVQRILTCDGDFELWPGIRCLP
jgi:predicted nucleic acid-binding protein